MNLIKLGSLFLICKKVCKTASEKLLIHLLINVIIAINVYYLFYNFRLTKGKCCGIIFMLQNPEVLWLYSAVGIWQAEKQIFRGVAKVVSRQFRVQTTDFKSKILKNAQIP